MNAIKRLKVIADHAVETISASGYPALTEPVGLNELKKMPPDAARAYLRDELARTTETDANGEMVPSGKTLDLISGYLRWEQGAADGEAKGRTEANSDYPTGAET